MRKFRSPSPVERKHRFPISLRIELSDLVKEIGQKSRWSLATTCEVLIEEALRARGNIGADNQAPVKRTMDGPHESTDALKPRNQRRVGGRG